MTGVAVDRLKENFAGEVVRPRDAEYDSLRAVFNGMIDRRPAAIARCTGAGAVGNAAVQLARWAGAEVMATVSDDAKAELATAPGAHHVVRYKEPDAAGVIRRIAPAGIDLIVEVAAGANAELDLAVLVRAARSPSTRTRRRTCSCGRAAEHGNQCPLPVRPALHGWLGSHRDCAGDINQAISDGAFDVGEQVGLPLHRFRSRTRQPHTRPWRMGLWERF